MNPHYQLITLNGFQYLLDLGGTVSPTWNFDINQKHLVQEHPFSACVGQINDEWKPIIASNNPSLNLPSIIDKRGINSLNQKDGFVELEMEIVGDYEDESGLHPIEEPKLTTEGTESFYTIIKNFEG